MQLAAILLETTAENIAAEDAEKMVTSRRRAESNAGNERFSSTYGQLRSECSPRDYDSTSSVCVGGQWGVLKSAPRIGARASI